MSDHPHSNARNAVKSAIFILLVPGFLLGVVPVLLLPRIPSPALPAGAWNWLALPFWLTGAAAMIWSAVDFVRKGHGTPLPLDPPKELVINGLYRFVRNPMYMGAMFIQAGSVLWFASLSQVVYWFFLFIGFTLFIRANEEPYLRRAHGAVYKEYCNRVPRWLPHIYRNGVRKHG